MDVGGSWALYAGANEGHERDGSVDADLVKGFDYDCYIGYQQLQRAPSASTLATGFSHCDYEKYRIIQVDYINWAAGIKYQSLGFLATVTRRKCSLLPWRRSITGQ